MKREPQRTCVGCQQVRPRSRLLRLVRQADGTVAVDQAGTAPGRGAYICPQPECVAETLKRGRLAKVFRGRTEASAELMGLAETLKSGVRRE